MTLPSALAAMEIIMRISRPCPRRLLFLSPVHLDSLGLASAVCSRFAPSNGNKYRNKKYIIFTLGVFWHAVVVGLSIGPLARQRARASRRNLQIGGDWARCRRPRVITHATMGVQINPTPATITKTLDEGYHEDLQSPQTGAAAVFMFTRISVSHWVLATFALSLPLLLLLAPQRIRNPQFSSVLSLQDELPLFIGTIPSALRSLDLSTEAVGKVHVSVGRINTIEFNGTNQEATVILQNGSDKLQGGRRIAYCAGSWRQWCGENWPFL